MGKLGRKVALIGAGMSKFGILYPSKQIYDIWVDAWLNAVNSVDNGISAKDINELFVGNFSADLFNHQGHLAPMLAHAVGLCPSPSTRIEAACSSGGLAFRQAVINIASGLNDVVAVGGVELMNEQSTIGVTDALAAASDITYEYYAGATFPGLYATIATAHFAKYGTTSEDLMQIAIKNHLNGKENPFAHTQNSISDIMELKKQKYKKANIPLPEWNNEFDFLKSTENPVIAQPLRLFDCSLVTDGAACVFLASEEVAKKYTDTPIWISGIGQGSDSLSIHDRKSITSFEATREAAKQAFSMAELTPKNIQIAEVHDCFTIAEILALEDIGFFKPGKAGEAIRNGVTQRNGDLPINTSGGLKAKGHPVGATGVAQVVEIFKQMRNQAERNRQVKANIEHALTQNVGGTGATVVVNIFSK